MNIILQKYEFIHKYVPQSKKLKKKTKEKVTGHWQNLCTQSRLCFPIFSVKPDVYLFVGKTRRQAQNGGSAKNEVSSHFCLALHV